MKITMDKWLDLQKKNIKTCVGFEDIVPQTVFIGTLKEDGTIELRIRLISQTVWKKFEKLWKCISGQKNPFCKDYLPPQFFLFRE